MFDLIIFEEPNQKKKTPNKQTNKNSQNHTFFSCRYYTANWVFNQYIIKGYLIK